MNKSTSRKSVETRGVVPTRLSERQSSLGAHVCVQREAEAPAVYPSVPSLVREVLNSPGQRLDSETRSFMEPQFGYDFSGVRVHNDEAAAVSVGAVNANAYTAGNHIAFAAQKYSPGTAKGKSLLAHELTHVIQQAGGAVPGAPIGRGLYLSDPTDPCEQAARRTAEDIFSKRPRSAANSLTPLRHRSHVAGNDYIQRDGLFGSQTASSDVGAVAGIVGAGLGAAALGLALYAYLRPPEALNPAPVTGGLSINPNPFTFNTIQPTPSMPQATAVHEPKSNQAVYKQAQKGPPKVQKVLDLRTDDKNHAELNIALRTDGYNVLDASVRTGAMQNYLGGSRGSSAAINFSAMQTAPAPGIFDAAEPKSGASEPSKSNQTTASPSSAREGEDTGQPSEVAEVTISYTGTNTKNQDPPQTFAGSITVDGKGNIDVAQPEVTNGVGRADKAANVAEIDYRAPVSGVAGEGSGDYLTPASGPGNILPRFDVPNPPILDRP